MISTDIDILPYESYLSIFYKLIRQNYASRRKILAAYGLSEQKHFCPVTPPQWLNEIVSLPFRHLPTYYCPSQFLLNSRAQIKYCPDCLAVGYHSVFFMIKNHDWCVIHGAALKEMCWDCLSNFIGDTSIEDYFNCSMATGKNRVFCSLCNISWPDLGDEYPSRPGLILSGESQSSLETVADWYFYTAQGAFNSSELCKSYFLSLDISKYTIGPLEARFNMPHPMPLKAINRGQRVYWIKFVNLLPAYRLPTSKYYEFRSLVSSYCDEIKSRYLCGHEDCYQKINMLTQYLPLCAGKAPFCLCSLAYVLFRLKMACAVWPTENSVAAENSCFDNLFKYISSEVKVRDLKKLVLFIFLKILGEIQYVFEQGKSTNFLLRSEPIHPDLFFIRRTSFNLRRFGCCDGTMEPEFWLETGRNHRGIRIVWSHDQESRTTAAF